MSRHMNEKYGLSTRNKRAAPTTTPFTIYEDETASPASTTTHVPGIYTTANIIPESPSPDHKPTTVYAWPEILNSVIENSALRLHAAVDVPAAPLHPELEERRNWLLAERFAEEIDAPTPPPRTVAAAGWSVSAREDYEAVREMFEMFARRHAREKVMREFLAPRNRVMRRVNAAGRAITRRKAF